MTLILFFSCYFVDNVYYKMGGACLLSKSWVVLPIFSYLFFELKKKMRVGIIGQGVIGSSTALAILEHFPNSSVTLFGDRPFEKTCSFGPAGLFRLDKFENKELARKSFERFAKIDQKFPGNETGIKLLSGHIQSDIKENLLGQEKNYGDIVYNFRWLTQLEIELLFPNPSKYCIHYTAYASEGRVYVPWLRKECEKLGAKYITREITTLKDLELDEPKYDVIINAAGLNAGKIAGDDDTVFPVRGIGFEVEAPWHKHFNYRDFTTFTIPMTNSVLVGSVKQPNRSDTEITDEDRNDIWERYLKLQPNFKNVKKIAEWSGIRPDRPSLRLEKTIKKNSKGQDYLLVHNYGHGGNGFTLGWGCALEVVKFIQDSLQQNSKI
uniref:FAD dependent oxidoreductase domain-containing protein n=1 Tax=Panagrolaimus sp. JU765 TaxID=591449 RepID=A0AC34QJR4_9BILA